MRMYGVSNISKISIQQQFTTSKNFTYKDGEVFQIFQRSQYNSNSQLLFWMIISRPGCFKYFKDLNTTAIHNSFSFHFFFTKGVSNISKISIQQQFTTSNSNTRSWYEVFQIFQRSQYNSNSQLRLFTGISCWRCFKYFKDLNTTAIHNLLVLFLQQLLGVSNISKISIQQQFTTRRRNNNACSWVFQIFQRSQYNSNSQQNGMSSVSSVGCFKYFKDLNTTAIHNRAFVLPCKGFGVSNISKISIQQQFTTWKKLRIHFKRVFQIFQRSQYNSNSQLANYWINKRQGCFKYFKDLNTTAIHN